MPKRKKRPLTVTIGGRQVPLPEAAFIAVEADQRKIRPRAVGAVRLPDPLPEQVELAGKRVSLMTAAAIAEEADLRETTPAQVVQDILEKHAAARRSPPTRSRRGS